MSMTLSGKLFILKEESGQGFEGSRIQVIFFPPIISLDPLTHGTLES